MKNETLTAGEFIVTKRQALYIQIHKEAAERYPIKRGCCRLERREILRLKQRFIDKKIAEFGLDKVDKAVNS